MEQEIAVLESRAALFQLQRILLGLLRADLVSKLGHAEERTADQLVASKRQVDMTYRQLMERMGAASAMIQEGLVRENRRWHARVPG